MKKISHGLLIISSLFLLRAVQAQDNPRFYDWLDDGHFILSNGKELFRVEAAGGREMPYEAPEVASDYLPEEVEANRRNSSATQDEKMMAVKHDEDLFLASAAEKTWRRLTDVYGEEQNPDFSPDEKWLAFTRNGNLCVMDLETGREKQLTADGSDVIYNGYASWVYFEEILGRSSFYQAFYWSPDSKRIAFLRFDDSPVPEFPIFHHEGEDMTHGYLEMTHYPKAGDAPPEVRLGIVDIESGEIVWADLNEDLVYTAWVYWPPGADRVFFQQMNRDQDTLHLYSADLTTGETTLVYEETQPTWVEFFEDIHFLEDNGGFILRSNRDGWYNLYHYDLEGNLVRQITDFDWRVTGITYVDEQNKRIAFEGTGGDGTQVHLFAVDLDGGNLRQVTKGEGYHWIDMAPGGAYFYDQYSSHTVPGLKAVYEFPSGKLVKELEKREVDPNAEAGIRIEHFTVPTGDGFDLPAYWVLPPDFDENKKYPVIFSIYGGPDAGTVYKRYRDYSRDPLVAGGVIYFSVDHRASGKFGKKGMDYMHRSLGKWEMNDYIEAVKWLRTKSFIDESRIGIQGGSYGGYMTAMALTYGAGYFTHGVSRSPVTTWNLYDNVYTERYMDTPEDNPEGYDFGSVMTHADKLEGKLLLIHGTIDDNVHMQNTIQLISKLQDLGKDFEMMVYPGGRHGWGGAKAVHSAKLARKFWMDNFVNAGPAQP